MNLTLNTYYAGLDNYLSVYAAHQLLAHHDGKYRVSWSAHWITSADGFAKEDRLGALSAEGGTLYALLEEGDAAEDDDGEVEILRFISFHRRGLSATVAASSEAAVEREFERLRKRYPIEQPTVGPTVPMMFWYMTEHGPRQIRRDIAVPSWPAVAVNYPLRTSGLLSPMMRWPCPVGAGQLVLWHGEPGTGKTWALRALASEWRDWCGFEYITDPDRLFGDGAYLTNVLLESDGDESKGAAEAAPAPRWRCLILEDTGELLARDAKAREGQALSRLLNTVDGLLGQGLRVLLLLTTNEDVKVMHPAVSRPGRCLYAIPFETFPRVEAAEWLKRRGAKAWPVGTHPTLAQLYAHAEEFPLAPPSGGPVGFRQADSPA